MASAYDKYYQSQPAAVKVIAVAGLGLLGYSIYRALKKDEDEKNAKKAAELANNRLAQLAAQGVHPSYDDIQFQVFVDTLVQSMTGCGTDEDMIYKVFQAIQNEADIMKLIADFGLQYYEPCWLHSPLESAIWAFNKQAYGGDLPTWLSYDLSAGEIGHINSILKSNGVSFQF